MKKINLSNESEVREKILSGIQKMSDLVGMTLGPAGRSVIIERGAGEPLIVDDGRRVAENIKFDDPVEQLAVRVCYAVTRKTDEKVGDGTTTSMILTNAILKEISKEIGGYTTVNVSELDQRIQLAKNEIFKKLDEMAKPIKTEKELIDVAKVITGNDRLGEIIGKMYFVLGKNGHISLEFNLLSNDIETETVSGYRFSGGYAAPWMITDALRKDCVMSDVDVLITKQKITDIKEIEPILNIVGHSGKSKLIIISPRLSDSVLKLLYKNAMRKNPFTVIGVRAPGRTEEAYKDMAIFTGGKYFSESDDLKLATREDLGHVNKIEITEDTTILIEGKGSKTQLDARVKEVLAEAAQQKLPQFKQDRLERASALSGGVGVIKIGAPTDEERNWLKYKIEDGKHATKHAYREGVIPGGGTALKEISGELSDDNILKSAILAPYNQLKNSFGGKMTIGKNVIDPVAVEKAALENACSAASKLIRIGGAISTIQPSLVEELQNIINAKHVEDELIQEDTE